MKNSLFNINSMRFRQLGINFCAKEKLMLKCSKMIFFFTIMLLSTIQVNAQNEFCGVFDPNASGACEVEEYTMDCAGDCLQGGQKNCNDKNIFCATVTLDLTCLGAKPCPDATVQSGVFQGCGNSSTANIALYLGGTCTEVEGSVDLGAPTGTSLTFITCSSSATQSFSGFSWVCPPCDLTAADCDDNDCTTMDTFDEENCACINTPIATPDCNDNDCTTMDSYDTDNCRCVNTPIVTPNCDDNDCTTMDSYDADNCRCVNTPIITPNCDDNDCTTMDFYDTDNCRCVNTPIPTPNCDDNDCTTADSYDTDICECVNTPIAQPVCDDGNCLTRDYYDTDICECVHLPIPVPTCDDVCEVYDPSICGCVTVIPAGTPCNDGLACTINDVYDEHCDCRGERVGIPGDSCDDGDDCTINDTLNEDCQCEGEPGPDSDRDGIPDCMDPCQFNIDEMVYADLKCGVTVTGNNFSGKSVMSDYGACSENCLAPGRELIYRFNQTSQSDIVVTFKEDAHPQLKKLNLFIITDPCTPIGCNPKYAINAPLMGNQDPEKVVIKDAAPGVYYIIVDGHQPYATGDFSLLLECTGGSVASCPDNAHYFESFEDYRVGKRITTQDPGHWSTVGNSSGSAIISNDRASNYEQSLEFNRYEAGAQDVNLELGRKNSGTYRISWDMYIHPMNSAHFGLFGGDNSDPWGSIGHTFRMMSTKYQGKWFNVEIYVDMDKNEYALYMDNRHFKETGKYYLNLHHLNFYSPPGGHFYVDNICYAAVESIPNLDSGSETSDDRRQDNHFTDDLTLFPNPATDEVLLDLRKYAGKEVDVVIYNAMSFEVYRKHIPQVGKDAERISLNNFTNGLYIVNVKGKGVRAKAKKLIVSRMY